MRHGSGVLAGLASRSSRHSALKQRFITAALLIPTLLAGLVLLPTWMVAVVLGSFVGLGAWEWAGLSGWSTREPRIAYVAVTLACLTLAYWIVGQPWAAAEIELLAWLWLLWWGVIFYWLIVYQWGGLAISPSKILWGGAGLLVMVPAWSALVALHGWPRGGAYLVVSLMLLVWAADTAAFFVGRRWGKHRLADRISPGKTWEGLMGGLGATVVVAWICSVPLDLTAFNRLLFLLLCLVTIVFSVLGDLFESLIKRLVGVKDSSSLLPGHGGVLDRIDSLIAAAPVFAIGVRILGIHP